MCWATATREWGIRRLQAKHKDFDFEKRDGNGELVMSPLDGVAVWVSDVDLEALGATEGPDQPEQQANDE
ncbi:MAG: hypothetical protein AVDCRST_MAG83-1726 [uncultured Arthrobacter sp.]|uniref:Uncharacterized protein n=1 Tax=uncultured Arthrobacter sp. TaxID=114050 RepID=A0A6J4I595_9MICC|nr:hypothetical protein [uncultured Arthrobacter sp.]CAA9242664.1 MAG: hypothetical protein AVDCRST_MAG83-1726 [uncultured Arthrobacter sp.]